MDSSAQCLRPRFIPAFCRVDSASFRFQVLRSPLFEAFEHYKPLIGTSDAIWAGDFNASFAFDRPSRRFKFRDFVSLFTQHGFRSLYHEQRGCQHGDEPEDTFYLYHHAERGFHIDFMFASSGFQPSTFGVSVGSHTDWARQSDHMPLICENQRGLTMRCSELLRASR